MPILASLTYHIRIQCAVDRPSGSRSTPPHPVAHHHHHHDHPHTPNHAGPESDEEEQKEDVGAGAVLAWALEVRVELPLALVFGLHSVGRAAANHRLSKERVSACRL